ncbi:MAG: GNAT family N-acetyltransferase [Bosea sp. (in: a-proteobacteria)]
MNQISARGDAAGSAGSAADPGSGAEPSGPLMAELRPLAACADIRAEWTSLAARAIEPNLFFEPDFVLAATQHLVAFGEAAAVLVWQGPEDAPRRRLLGLFPCFRRNRLFGSDELVGFSDRRIANGAPLIDAAMAQPVIETALSLRHEGMPVGRGLVLRQIALDSPILTPMLAAAERLGLSATLRPSKPMVRQAGLDLARARATLERRGELSLTETSARGEVRDAVELVLALDASGASGRSGAAALQDTREVGFLRALTRGLARQRQCRLALLALDGEPIAGAILLGRARASYFYMGAQDDAHADCAPLRVLLALLRQNAGRTILNTSSLEPPLVETATAELQLKPQAAMTPRDLAGRAREALRRSFSRAPARRAG